jgi:15-hydroxyprostaglandin dehydrogenase (NAD)
LLDLAYGSGINTDIWNTASGVGLAVAKSLLSDGWNVVGLDWNEEASAEAMRGAHGLAIYQADVSDYPELAAAFARTWKRYGQLDFGKHRIRYE